MRSVPHLLMLSFLLLAATGWLGVAAAHAGPRLDRAPATPEREIPFRDALTVRATRPDLVVQGVLPTRSDLAGVPGEGFCGWLGGQTVVRVSVRNVGDAASDPAALTFRYLSTGVHEIDTIPALAPGERRVFDFVVPNGAWAPHPNGNGASVPFEAVADPTNAVTERSEQNNRARSVCLGGPVD